MHVSNEMIRRELRVTGYGMKAVMALMPAAIEFKRQWPGYGKNNFRLCRKDGSEFRVLVHGRGSKEHRLPGFMWIHGGGYSGGMPEMIYMSRAKDAFGKCVVVAPDYTLSGIRPYPAGLEDCCQALEWMLEHADELGIRTDQIFVGGESAGGGLAVAVCLYMRDQGKVKIACQMPLYPMLDDRMQTESMRDNNAPVWSEEQNRKAWDLYLRDLPSSQIPVYAAPGREENLKGLPPAISFTGGIEPFRDENISYLKKLRACGIPVKFKVFPGCYHAFDLMCPGTKVARESSAFFTKALDEAIRYCHREN